MKDRGGAITTRNCTCATRSSRHNIAKDRFSAKDLPYSDAKLAASTDSRCSTAITLGTGSAIGGVSL